MSSSLLSSERVKVQTKARMNQILSEPQTSNIPFLHASHSGQIPGLFLNATISKSLDWMTGEHPIHMWRVALMHCGKEFSRRYNMERHMMVVHPFADSEEDSSTIEDLSEVIDHGAEVSDSQRSSDDNSSSDDQSWTDDEEEDDSVWTSIRELLWTQEIDDTFDNKKAELVEGGMSNDDAHQIAYKHALHNLRWNITMNCMKKILGHTKLRQDPIHQKNLENQAKVARGRWLWIWGSHEICSQKKYLILKATGTLSDDDLEEDDENP